MTFDTGRAANSDSAPDAIGFADYDRSKTDALRLTYREAEHPAVHLPFSGSAVPEAGDLPAIGFLSPLTRIENIEALASELSLAPGTEPAELLIAAWNMWGIDTAARLRGAFAFTVVEENGVFMVRDPIGLSSLLWCRTESGVWVGDNSRSVRAAAGSNAIDLETVARFVIGRSPDHDRTFYQNLNRVPPAHCLHVTRKGVAALQYWDMQTVQPLSESRSSRLAETFRKTFDTSVQGMLGTDQAHLLLSGGLDSSAIAGSLHASGQAKRIGTLSLTYPGSDTWCDAPHLEAIVEHMEFDAVRFPSDGFDPLSDMSAWLDVLDGPYMAPGHAVSSRLYAEAAARGSACVLSGHGGDEVIGRGFGRLNELARSGHWLRLWRELRGASELYGDSRISLMFKYLQHIPMMRRGRRFKARILSRLPASGATNDTPSQGLGCETLEAAHILPEPLRPLVEDDAPGIPIRQRPDHTERDIHEATLSAPMHALALEVLSLSARACGVRLALPFYNQQLVEMSLAAPAEWKLHEGQSRRLLREAMVGRMPDAVRLRRDKFDFGHEFTTGLFSDMSRLKTLLLSPRLEPYVHTDMLSKIRKTLSDLSDDGQKARMMNFPLADAFLVWRLAVLSLWLQTAEHRLDPAVEPVLSTALPDPSS